MEVVYYPDTDTVAFVISSTPSADTGMPTDDVTLDWDADGKLTMVTIEHPTKIEGFDLSVLVRTL